MEISRSRARVINYKDKGATKNPVAGDGIFRTKTGYKPDSVCPLT